MKSLFLFILFTTSLSAFADTYYCTQTAKVLVEQNNKIRKYYKFDDIYKLIIDTKKNNLTFASLDELNATKDLSKVIIPLLSQTTQQIFARFQTEELLTDMKINFYPSTSTDSKLARTMSSEKLTFVEYFQCTKEEKY